LLLSLLAALYAFKQEFIGFSASEEQFLHSDPGALDLLFIDGHWRKFSFLSDPVAFSYNMVISSILAVCMTGATKKIVRKIALLLLAVHIPVCDVFFRNTRRLCIDTMRIAFLYNTQF
jgi:putative inorganic carbon (HCO3(-)) transporter